MLPMEQALQSAASTAGTDATPLQHLVDTMLAALHATVHDPQTRRVFQIATHRVGVRGRIAGRGGAATGNHAQSGGVTEQAIAPTLAPTAGHCPCPCPPPRWPAHAGGRPDHHWLLDTQAFDLEEVGRQTLLTNYVAPGLDWTDC